MRQITFLCERALNSLENMSVDDLLKLQQMAKDDFEEAFKGLCKAESEERLVSYYWEKTLESVKKNPVPFDNEHVHAVTHVEKHAGELDNNMLSKERWEYLIRSFGWAMHLSCQLYLETQKWIKKKS